MSGYDDWSQAGWRTHLPGVADVHGYVSGPGDETIPRRPPRRRIGRRTESQSPSTAIRSPTASLTKRPARWRRGWRSGASHLGHYPQAEGSALTHRQLAISIRSAARPLSTPMNLQAGPLRCSPSCPTVAWCSARCHSHSYAGHNRGERTADRPGGRYCGQAVGREKPRQAADS